MLARTLPPRMEDDLIHITDPIRDSGWDRMVSDQPDASFYHSAPWARVLHDAYGYTPLYLSSGTGPTGAILPLLEVRSRWTGRRGVSLPFTDECPAGGTHPAAFQRLFEHARQIGVRRAWRYLELRGAGTLIQHSRPSVRYHVHRIPLEEAAARMFCRLDGAVRRAVRKAERSALRVEITSDAGAVREFYGLLCLTRRRHGIPPQPYRFYECIHRHVLSRGLGALVLVRIPGGKAVAGALFLHGHRTVVMKFAASDMAYQHLRINNLALWTALQHYGRSGFETLDLGRTSLSNAGLRSFKRRWGAVERDLSYHRYDFRRGAFMDSPDPTACARHRLFQLLPLSISRWAGQLLYRHMA
jgi:hypothetical protein